MRTLETQTPPIDYIVQRIVDTLNPRRIVLFGSYARGTPHADSDLDLMVEMETDLSRPYRDMRVYELFPNRRWSMDAVVYTPAEVEARRDQMGSLMYVIEREGRTLYERL